MTQQIAEPIHNTTPRVETEVISSQARLTGIRSEWSYLVETSPQPNPFLTWEWVTAWLDIFAQGDDIRVLVARDPKTQKVVGIAPFVIQKLPRRGPTLWKELVFMGCRFSGPDHLDCISAPSWSQVVSKAFAEWILTSKANREWDVVRFDGATPESEFLEHLLEGTGELGAAVWEIPCPYVPLPDTWEEYEGNLKGKFRRGVNRRIRKLEREASKPVTMLTIETEEELERGLVELFRLHQSRRDEGTGAFNTPLKRDFYRKISLRFLRQGWLRLHLLMVGDRAIATACCFSFGGKVWCYQTGFDYDWNAYGPGFSILQHAIRSAVEEGAREFDLLRGDHAYKFDWNAEVRFIQKAKVASSPVGGIVVPTTRVLRNGKERWKEWQGTH